MINILPEPKRIRELGGFTAPVKCFHVQAAENAAEIAELCQLRFWNCPGISFNTGNGDLPLQFIKSLEGVESDKPELLKEQGLLNPEYVQKIVDDHIQNRRNYGGLLWALYVFEKWYQRYFDN